jgi:hypothetical protein
LLAARRARNQLVCERCSRPFGSLSKRQRFCSKSCAVSGKHVRSGSEMYNWKGGRTSTPGNNGYVKVRAPDHPRARKSHPYVLEHILVMEQELGRFLLPNERVHHKNGKRDDNRADNLELWKMKDPPGVRASDYHCAGCACEEIAELDRLAESNVEQHMYNVPVGQYAVAPFGPH